MVRYCTIEKDKQTPVPEISVLMLAYNAEKYIGEAISSILQQSYSDFELIIYNDGSTDQTAAIVGSFADARIRFIDNDVNRGLSHARRASLQEAKGKYVAVLDSDDIAMPHRLKIPYTYMEAHPDVALCGGNAILIDEHGQANGGLLHKPYKARDLLGIFFFNNIFVNSSTMFRRDIALRVGGYRDMEQAEDYDLFVRIADQYHIHTFNEALVYYRLHSNNTSLKNKDIAIALLKTIKKQQLRMLGVDDEKFGDVFDALLWGRYERFGVSEFLELLVTLKTKNRESSKLPVAYFERKLYAMWYDLVMAKIEKKKVLPLLKHKSLYHVKVLSWKHFRRIMKLSLQAKFMNR